MSIRYSPEAIRQTRFLTGFAVSLDPVMIGFNHQPEGYRNDSMTRNWNIAIDQSYDVLSAFEQRWPSRPLPPEESVHLFRNALKDVRVFTQHIADVHPPDLDAEAIIRIASHPKSIETMAALAAHSNGISSTMLHQGSPFYSPTLTPTGPAMKGSPMAFDVDHRSYCPEAVDKGEIKPTPLFRRWVPWAATVAAYSLVRTKNQPLHANENHEAHARKNPLPLL